MAFKFQPGFISQRTAMALNELARTVERLEPMLRNQGDTGQRTQEQLIVKITAVDGSGAYSGTEQSFTTSGAYEDLTNGRVFSPSDKPIYERNGTIATAFPFYADVTLRQLVDGVPTYEFNAPPTAEVIDISGRTGSVADVTALQILRGVISGMASAAVFTPDDATNSLPGIVSLSDQTMGDGVKTFLDGSANEGGIYVGVNGVLAQYDPTVGAKTEHFEINRQAGGPILDYQWIEASNSSVLTLKAYDAGPAGFMDLRIEWTLAAQGVIAGSAAGGADGRFGVNVGGTDFMGASGTSGGGDTVKGGIITTLGSGPSAIDGGTWV